MSEKSIKNRCCFYRPWRNAHLLLQGLLDCNAFQFGDELYNRQLLGCLCFKMKIYIRRFEWEDGQGSRLDMA